MPVIRILNRISDACALIAAWLFFAIGVMLVYEVASRYLFNAPTIWAEELSRFFQLWAVYGAAAAVLRQGGLIRVTLVTDRIGESGRRVLEILALLFIAAFCAVAVFSGWEIARDSLEIGRTSASMLNLPMWWSEIVIPLGMGLLFVQCLAEIVLRLMGGPLWPNHEAELGE